MKRMILASALALAAGLAVAQPSPDAPGPGGWGPGWGMGPGMMGGYGPGYGPGHGPGWGMGPRGGYGPGYHMGGGRGAWGPGMMGGYGPGWGMGPGMIGPGMMGFGAGRAMWLPDLTEKQRGELAKIQDETRRKQWEIAGKMHDEMAAVRDATAAPGKRDRAAALAAFDRMTALRRQRLEIALDTADRVDQVLTPEQREKLRNRGPWWGPDGGGPR